MLSIGTIKSAGLAFYFTALATVEYYLNGGEPPGHWYGRAAAELGLTGEVTSEDLHAVLDGFGPDGSKLVQNAGKENRQDGLDLTFSAPKSVSILWALGDKETRAVITRAHEWAVDAALTYVQEEAAWTRRGHGGEKLERCELLFARFNHHTSRASDPNLHAHVLVPNIGLREDGSTGALANADIYRHKMAAGSVYRAALAHELGPRGLGFPLHVDTDRGLFRISSVPESVTEHYSKRRAQIEAELRETGRYGARAADHANLRTRDSKGHEPLRELESKWRWDAMKLGFIPQELPARDEVHVEPSMPLQTVAQEQAERLSNELGTFRSQDLVRAVAAHAMDGRTRPEHLLLSVRETLRRDNVIEVGESSRGMLFTTEKQVDSELDVLHLAGRLSERSGTHVSEKRAAAVEKKYARQLDTPERLEAFRYLTSPGDIKVLSGFAGTGKTRLLRAANDAWKKEGLRAVGVALAGKAARELEEGAGIPSETFRMRQLQLEPTALEQLKHHTSELVRAARYGTHTASFDTKVQAGLEGVLKDGKWGRAPGYEPRRFERLKLDSKTVVVIDECSMLGVADTAQLLRLAEKAGAKVVMAGDSLQLPAINAVSPFEAIGLHVGQYELRGIKRQEQEWMQHAVTAFAEGDIETGLSLLQTHGSLHMSKGGPAATRELLVDQWEASGARVEDRLVLASTREEVAALNSVIQARCRERRQTGFLTVTLGSGEAARRGDRVLFNRNHRGLEVRNGDLGTITRIHNPVDANVFNRGIVTVRLDSGKKVRVDLNKYGDTSLGFALSTHKAQGVSVDHAFVYTTPERASRDMLYVQASRARVNLDVYCPGHDLGEDHAELVRSLGRESSQSRMATLRAFELGQDSSLGRESEGLQQEPPFSLDPYYDLDL